MMMAKTDSSTLDEKCQLVLEALYNQPKEQTSFEQTSQQLAEFRILTREKKISQSVLDERCMKTLVKYSSQNQIEAQKCLSNLILNYAHLRQGLIEPYVDCVEQRLKNILSGQSQDDCDNNSSIPNGKEQHCEVLYYDLRIIFLLSALCSASRINVRDRLLDLLMKVTLMEADKFRKDNYLLVIESLKTLFNLTMDKCIDTILAAKVIKKLFSVVGTEGDQSATNREACLPVMDHTDKLLVNLIHLLTNMPKEVYLEMSDEDADKVLEHLDEQLKTFSKNSFRDTVLPVLNTCANICRYKESVRQRWFNDIIGSTKEFEKRPEEYDTLRGRLVKLMTSVDVHIKEIAAEFLHALCGGDTEKFITYTGFGNSAAFLATKGLLSQTSRRNENGAEMNDEPQNESDKEYRELRGKLDPITGRIEQPKRDPMEGMSEEEKEWHANELAGAIAKLSSLGVVKPMQVGPDGRVSELCPQSDVGKEKLNKNGHDDDDDSD